MTLGLIIWLQALVVQSLDSAIHRINPYPAVKYQGCFLALRKTLLVRFCVSLWELFRVFSIFCITSYHVILRHTSLYYVITPVLNTKKLQLGKPVALSTSPLLRGLFVLWGGLGERKRERAGHDGRGEERTEAFRLFSLPIAPRALSIFFFRLLLFLQRYPAGASAKERCYPLYRNLSSGQCYPCFEQLETELDSISMQDQIDYRGKVLPEVLFKKGFTDMIQSWNRFA